MSDFSQTGYGEYQEFLKNPDSGFGGYNLKSNGRSVTNERALAYRYFDSTTNIGVRPEFGQSDYDYFRGNEIIPRGRNERELHQIMNMCYNAYERVGIIRSVVDMMVDLAIEGLEIVHEDKGPNEFWKAWQKKIDLKDRAEKFLLWFYGAGNTVVRRRNATIDRKNIRKLLEMQDVTEMPEVVTIPVSYIFYNPATVHCTGSELSTFTLKKLYSIRVKPTHNAPSNPFEESIYKQLTKEVKDSIEGQNLKDKYYVPIPPELIYVANYKKVDTQIWGKSFIYSILDDILYNDKLKLAKMSTLDNMISIIRLWKLGDHKEELFPTPAAGAKLAEILQNNTGGGPIDIIWGSDLDLEEFYPPIDKLVNFDENHNNILLGLGVPEILIGGVDSKSSSATSTLGLKNIIKRLESGRRALTDWLNTEIDIIMSQLRFRKRPQIRFSNSDLYDERSYFNLIVQLVDRGIISDERVLEILDELPEMEKLRVYREGKERDEGIKPPKASPYHNPQLQDTQDFEMKKQKNAQKAQEKQAQTTNVNNESKKVGKEPRDKGRPGGSKDSYQRKRRPEASLVSFAYALNDKLESLVNNTMVKEFGKSNLRQLTSEERDNIERIKITIMSKIKPTDDLSKVVDLSMGTIDQNILSKLNRYFGELLTEDNAITYEHCKNYRALAYIYAWSDDENLSD